MHSYIESYARIFQHRFEHRDLHKEDGEKRETPWALYLSTVFREWKGG